MSKFTLGKKRATRLMSVALVGALIVVSLGAASSAEAKKKNEGTPGGYKSMSLTATADGKILVKWKKTSSNKKYRIDVASQPSTTKKLKADLKSYTVKNSKTSMVVAPAKGAGTGSANWTWVKLYAYKKSGVIAQSSVQRIQVKPIAPPTTGASIKMATFNVRTWGEPQVAGQTWPDRLPLVANEIRKSGADVVAIQEAGVTKNPSPGTYVFQFDQLVAALGGDYLAVSNAYYPVPGIVHGGGKQDTRMLYNPKTVHLDSQGYFEVPHAASKSATDNLRWYPWANLTQLSTGKGFSAIAMHGEVGADKKGGKPTFTNVRVAEVAKVVAKAKELAAGGRQVIVAGDMNSGLYSFPYNGVSRAFVKAGFYDAAASANVTNRFINTYNAFNKPQSSAARIDYIFTYGGPRGSYQFVNQSNAASSPMASDHNLQWAIVPIG